MATAQQRDTLTLSLMDAIELARGSSVEAIEAKSTQEAAYWEWRTYKASQLPELSMSANLPSYTRNFVAYQHSDGSYSYVQNNYLGVSGGFSIVQNIPWTGGQIQLNTSLDFMSQIGDNTANEFMSVPFEITLVQPIFGFNYMKWDKKIEPLKYEEATRKFEEDMVGVSLSTIASYFNALMVQSQLNIARQNLENSEKLYNIALLKREIGEISLQELSQLQLQALQAKATLTEAESSLRAQMFSLSSYLGLDQNQAIRIEMPDNSPDGYLNYADVLGAAMRNSSFAKSVMRQSLEAEYRVANAKGNMRSINLYASFGYSGVDDNFAGSYSGLVNNQILQVGLTIPILDWGKRKAVLKTAQSNKDVVDAQLNREKISFQQNIFLLTENYNNQGAQVEIARESNELARNNYDVALQLYISGDYDILSLNDASSRRDAAELKLIEDIYMYWSYYYQVEMTCLEKVDNLIMNGEL